ncbi:hypothetical protein J8273_0176 [Carpediemonas membranifera]|uniref:Uncharacterized protein n=1 Tax=Carpediemonas membranifera TaxID=201153 RepID=A0A8J6B3J8_9EUKA|nr:hypothetical protein J8273_0176 [Carpediemonas membranifera]|eukprot:KAG9394968.1 hypothetical protein J8273_0176 [Carpediemonas membranifera]
MSSDEDEIDYHAYLMKIVKTPELEMLQPFPAAVNDDPRDEDQLRFYRSIRTIMHFKALRNGLLKYNHIPKLLEMIDGTISTDLAPLCMNTDAIARAVLNIVYFSRSLCMHYTIEATALGRCKYDGAMFGEYPRNFLLEGTLEIMRSWTAGDAMQAWVTALRDEAMVTLPVLVASDLEDFDVIACELYRNYSALVQECLAY